MKLVISIVSNDDGVIVMEELTRNGFYVTKLATSGGLLRTGNMTLLTGVEDEKVDDVIEILREFSSKRKQLVEVSQPAMSDIFLNFPVEVTVGGATVFVIDIDRFEKL
ncbi:MAG: cyclic-di-AMP receptor [Clostridiales bacterium]|nr:cyclic-di-AMP receptor [Clostridiales bacterium]